MHERPPSALVVLAFGLVVFYGGPILYLAATSLSGPGGESRIVTFASFRMAIGDPAFRQAIGLSVLLASVSVSLQLGLALPAALLSREHAPLPLLLRSVLASSYFVPTTSVLALWLHATDPAVGPLALALRSLGIHVNFRSEALAPVTTVGLATFEGIGFVYLVLLARVLQIPAAHFELVSQGSTTGAAGFRLVYWPQIRATVLGLAVLRGIIGLSKFDAPWLAFARIHPSPFADTFAIWVYRNVFELGRAGVAAAGAVLFLGVGWGLFHAVHARSNGA